MTTVDWSMFMGPRQAQELLVTYCDRLYSSCLCTALADALAIFAAVASIRHRSLFASAPTEAVLRSDLPATAGAPKVALKKSLALWKVLSPGGRPAHCHENTLPLEKPFHISTHFSGIKSNLQNLVATDGSYYSYSEKADESMAAWRLCGPFRSSLSGS